MGEYIIECEYDFDDGWIPGEQREEIVRCRDCKHYNTELYRYISCELLGRYVEPDSFCAWGERQEIK